MAPGFIHVGKTDDFPAGRGRAVDAAGVTVAVFKLEGGDWFALKDACPHMGASLADGKIVKQRRVTCHWHGWTFDLGSGECDMRSWACAAAYEVRVVDGEVYVKPPPEKKPEPVEEEEWIAWDPDRFFKKK